MDRSPFLPEDPKDNLQKKECGEEKLQQELLSPVNSHNEWDPLEEVIIGNVEGSVFSLGTPQDKYVYSRNDINQIEKYISLSKPYPKEIVSRAQKALDQLAHILKSEGVIVREIEPFDFTKGFSSPDWYSSSGFCAANPRDLFLIVGDEIIETPMSCRERFFEQLAYKKIFKEYFLAGAKWTAAPRPALLDELYDSTYNKDSSKKHGLFCLTEFEPVFDAADFVRCGRDIFGQLSHITNKIGVEWLCRHLGSDYRVHLIENLDSKAWHIDTSFMPLCPGKVLVNPEFVNLNKLPSILKNWELLIAPPPVPYTVQPRVMSNWISINTLMLDEQRIIVEERQKPLIAALKEWGFSPIPCPFEEYYPFLGGFHCATLDIRRTGFLQSYF